jgi:hypothetical protein
MTTYEGMDRESAYTRTLDNPSRTMPGFIGRTVFYLLAIGGVMQLLLTYASSEDYVEQFREGDAVEWFQQFLILGSALLLGAAAWAYQTLRPLLTAMALLASVAVIRELDSLFDRLIPVMGWYLPGGLLLAAAVVTVIRHRRTLGYQMAQYAQTFSAGVIWCGFITVVVFAQIIGQADKWRPLLGESYTRHIKRVIEESCETFGYMLLFFGAVEALFWALHRRRSSQDT